MWWGNQGILGVGNRHDNTTKQTSDTVFVRGALAAL